MSNVLLTQTIDQADLLNLLLNENILTTTQTLRNWQKAGAVTAPRLKVLKKGGKSSTYRKIAFVECKIVKNLLTNEHKIPIESIKYAKDKFYDLFLNETKDDFVFHRENEILKNFWDGFSKNEKIPEIENFYNAYVFLKYYKLMRNIVYDM